jgi:UDP-glucose 4-epimerase
MKIAITGASGYIGSWLAKKLKDHDLVLLDNFSTPYTIQVRNVSNHEIIKFDIADGDEDWNVFTGVDVIFHLAAVSGIKACENSFDAYMTNVVGTSLITAVAEAAGVKKIIFASSMSVYKETDKEIIEESTLSVPSSNKYARQKLCGELILQSSKVPSVILRKSNVYGEGFFTKTTVIDAFINKVLKGENLVIEGTGEQYRNFVHLEDVVDAYIQAIDWEPGVYNIGGPDNLSISQLADMVIDEAKKGGVLIEKIIKGEGGGAGFKNINFSYEKARGKGFNPKHMVLEEIKKRFGYNSNMA